MNVVEAGRLLKEVRTAAGMTQHDLARALEMTVTTVSNWETEKNPPRRSDAQRVDALLNAGGRLMSAWGYVTPTDEVAELRRRVDVLQAQVGALVARVEALEPPPPDEN